MIIYTTSKSMLNNTKMQYPNGLHYLGYVLKNDHENDPNYSRGIQLYQARTKDLEGGDKGPDQTQKAKPGETFLDNVAAEEIIIGTLFSLLDPESFEAQKAHRDFRRARVA